MRKVFMIILAAAGLTYFGLLPFHANDVSDLLPVETVIITRSGDEYRVDIGEGVRAIGRTVGQALDNLKEQVTGTVFFQTAEQVIVQQGAEEAIEEVVTETRFRPAAGLYLTPETELDAQEVSAYLKTRRTELTLGEANAMLVRHETVSLPTLVCADGGYRILA